MTAGAAGTWCLLTYFSTLLCYDAANGELVHVPIGQVPEGLEPVTFRHDPATGRLAMFRLGGPDLYSRARTIAIPPARLRFGPFDLAPGPRDRLIHLRVGEEHLTAERGGTVRVRPCAARQWETFLLVSPSDVEDLRFLLSHHWLLSSGPKLVPKEQIALGRDFILTFGDRQVALPDNLPLAFRHAAGNTGGFTQATLFLDGWKLEDIRLFRPLVYFVAFGDETVMQMLEVSLTSLTDLCGYDGDVLVITDRTARQLVAYIPASLEGRLHTWTVAADDRIDYTLARYLIPHWPEAGAFQPLLYSDVDVCFDRDPRAMLMRLLLYPKLSAQRENLSASRYESVGAPLLREDDIETGDRKGFNAGVLGIPSIATHGELLLKIAETFARYAAHAGKRRPFRWIDQPFANYVAIKTDGFDLDLLSDYVRDGNGESGSPTGVLHLWSARPSKLDAMRRYLAGLRAQDESQR